MPINLELVTTRELLDALVERFDAIVISGVQDRCDTVEGEGLLLSWRRKGDHHRCIGLAHSVAARVQRDLDDITELGKADHL